MGIRMITVDRINNPIDIYAKDDARFYYSLIGAEGVHNVGNCLDAEKQGTNSIAVKDGVLSVMGRYAIIDPSDDEVLTLEMNQTGYNRNDLVVAEFNSNSGDETIVLKVLKGVATTGTATDPVLIKNDLTQGGTIRQVALHRIKWKGTSVETIERYAPILPNLATLVEKQENCIELTENTDLKEFFVTASDYTSYCANAQVAVNNGIPNRDIRYPVYYVKLRDFVLAYGRDTIRNVYNLFVATFHEQKLGTFQKVLDSQLISNSLSITNEGYALDARQGKILDEKIKVLDGSVKSQNDKLEKIDNCVKYNQNFSTSNQIPSEYSNPLTFMRDKALYYAWYNSEGLKGNNGCLPDTGRCYYYKVGNMIFGYALATHKYYFSDHQSDVWYECVSANTSTHSVTLEGVLLAKASNNADAGTAIIKISRDGGSTIVNEIRAMADGSILFKKTSSSSADVAQAKFGSTGALTIPNKLFAAGADLSGPLSGTSAKFSGKVEGGSISSSGDIVSSKAVQGESIKASFVRSDSGNTLFKALMGDVEIFSIVRDKNGVIRFATKNNTVDNYPLYLHQNGTVEAPSDLQVDGTLKGTNADFSGTVKSQTINASTSSQSKLFHALFDEGTSGNTFFKATMNNNMDIFRILRDSNDVIRFAVKDVYPLLLHDDGTAEAVALMTSLIKNNGNIQLKYSGGADVTLSKSSSGTAGYWRPTSDKNESNLGSASYKWNTVYATNTSTQSDRKDKREIEGIEKALDFIMNLQPVQYKFKNSSTKQGRTHYGFIAQDVATIAKDLGENLSLVKASYVIENKDGTFEDGYYNGSEDIPDEKLAWSLDYNEFIAPLVAVVQEQQKRIEELEKKLSKL